MRIQHNIWPLPAVWRRSPWHDGRYRCCWRDLQPEAYIWGNDSEYRLHHELQVPGCRCNAHDAKISFRAGATAGDTAKAAAEALKGVFGDGYTVTASGADVTVSATELGQNKTQFISGTISIQETQSGTAYTTLPLSAP